MDVRETCVIVQNGAMDPLDDVLAHLGVSSRVSSTLVAGTKPWRLRFDPPDGLKFTAVLAGDAVLRTRGSDSWRPVTAGDSYLLARRDGFELASSPSVDVARPASELFARARDGVAHVHADADEPSFVAVGASFEFDRAAERLLSALPPVLLVPHHSDAAARMRQTLVQIDGELRGSRPGAAVVAEHLAIVLLVQTIRWHLTHDVLSDRSWLAGSADPVVAPALRAIHADPARRWTVAELARTSGVSRSTLAERFRTVVGSGPVEYVADWRMELAAARLQRSDVSVAALARSLGYGSESAFSNAFKRVRGIRPSQARRGARARTAVAGNSSTPLRHAHSVVDLPVTASSQHPLTMIRPRPLEPESIDSMRPPDADGRMATEG